ncbi:hypothetical protein [Streptomyces sp. NPDC059761]|uniref:hypothetical protein n=1 Tax=Streptomyces sp. NPDC059761 TaxID=3346937 RepID=UPI0036539405
MSVSGDGHWVAAASEDGAVSLFSSTGVLGGAPVPNGQGVKAGELTYEKRFAFRTVDGGTSVWAVTGSGVKSVGRIPVPLTRTDRFEDTDTVVVSSDGTRAVTAQGQSLGLRGHSPRAAVSGDRTTVALRGDDGRLQVWRWSDDESLTLVRKALVVQPGGSGETNFLKLWDATTGEARGTLVRRALDLGSWRAILCALVPDPLPDTDYDRYLKGLDIAAPCSPHKE